MTLSTKRPRGRPPVEQPLTPAERARRYRERKRAKGTPTTSQPAPAQILADGSRPERILELEQALGQARATLADYQGALSECYRLGVAGKRLPRHVLEGLFRLLRK